MKKRKNVFLLFLCLCFLSCSCTLPHRTETGNQNTIFHELPPDNSIFADMDMVILSGYYTYHYDKANIESYYDTDSNLLLHRDGVHHSQVYSYSYEYDKDGNLTLKLFYNRLYNEKINLYRYEYDFWGCMVKQYKYDIDFERYRDFSLPLSNNETFYFSYGTDKTLIMKRLSASQEVLSAIHCDNGRFRVQYIGDEQIKWR